MGVKVNRKDRRVVEQDRFGGEFVVFRAVERISICGRPRASG